MKHIQPPDKIPDDPSRKIFLAGSIEMGSAENWQDKFINGVKDLDVIILNPRRDHWDTTWSHKSIEFRQQVEWELHAQNIADSIVFYFDPATKSPITLLELGLNINGNIFVCCPEGYWRKGNVDIVCEQHDICVLDTLEDLIEYIRKLYGCNR
jgi:hypothetical protein